MARRAGGRHPRRDGERISQALTQRVKELAERYAMPLPQQVGKVAELEQQVNAHLAKMGFSVY
jgi:type I restriction enzyme M protein